MLFSHYLNTVKCYSVRDIKAFNQELSKIYIHMVIEATDEYRADAVDESCISKRILRNCTLISIMEPKFQLFLSSFTHFSVTNPAGRIHFLLRINIFHRKCSMFFNIHLSSLIFCSWGFKLIYYCSIIQNLDFSCIETSSAYKL